MGLCACSVSFSCFTSHHKRQPMGRAYAAYSTWRCCMRVLCCAEASQQEAWGKTLPSSMPIPYITGSCARVADLRAAEDKLHNELQATTAAIVRERAETVRVAIEGGWRKGLRIPQGRGVQSSSAPSISSTGSATSPATRGGLAGQPLFVCAEQQTPECDWWFFTLHQRPCHLPALSLQGHDPR